MRYFLIYAFALLFISQTAMAQVDIRAKEPTKKEQAILVADSTDIDKMHGERYVGERVILYQKPEILYTYSGFDKKRYNVPLFTYFDVVGFKAPQEFKLRNVETGDECYFMHFGMGVKPVMTVKRYQYYKNHNLGSEWCIENRDGVWRIVDIWLEEGSIAQRLQCIGDTTTIEQRTMWSDKRYTPYLEYIDKFKGKEWVVDENNIYGVVDTISVRKGKPYLLFKDKENKEYAFDIDHSSMSSMPHGLSIGLLPTFTKDDAQKYIRKFGLKCWKDILGATPKVGMTEEILYLTIGTPLKTQVVESQRGVTLILYYLTEAITLHNGLVKEIWHN
ncbi:MAG: hypothetical protein NC548_65845 [Lachnospiraceae bacterium]|nr:hypothetical protein [Lachnospiraceae bacterium]